MRSVKIADLKNRLTQYLREVRKGQEIVVCDRNRPIAKIVPLVLDEDADRAALVAEGLLRPGQGTLPRSFWTRPRAAVTLDEAVRAVTSDRQED